MDSSVVTMMHGVRGFFRFAHIDGLVTTRSGASSDSRSEVRVAPMRSPSSCAGMSTVTVTGPW